MNRQLILILLLMLQTVILHSQVTQYFDANNNRVSTLDSASTYSISVPDTIRKGNLIETFYFKSGKIKSTCSVLLQFKLNANKTIIQSYTSGKVAWYDPAVEKHLERLKDGIYKEWYENGQIRKEVEYSEGKRNGRYISYWENGQKKREELMNNNKSVEGKCFDINGDEIKYTQIEQMPEFPGGDEKLMAFLRKNIKYPRTMMEKNIQGRVIAQFTVKKDGSLSDIKIVRSIHPLADEEALRIISLMPNWKPGIQEDELVNVKYTLPINFRLTDNNNTSPVVPRKSTNW
ncbi:MAG: TonB family protein [Paludibacter sp.]